MWIELPIIVLLLLAIAVTEHSNIRKSLCKKALTCKLLVLSTLFITAFFFAAALDLSPFNQSSSLTDSSVFIYIGKQMHNGLVPYKDLFDHKGPMLYIIEYLGILIGFGSEVGVWIIELINIFLFACISYNTARLFVENRAISCLAVFSVLKLSALSFLEGGNLVEEYALPYIALTLYFVISFFKTGSYKEWHIVAIGASFAATFLLRVNMIIPWIPLILAVIIQFILKKEFDKIYKCALLFIAGAAAAFAPILLYLAMTNSFGDMIECYFEFNFSYIQSDKSLGLVAEFFCLCFKNARLAFIFIAAAAVIGYKCKSQWINLSTFAVAFISMLMSGMIFLHYAIILIPFFIIPTITVFSFVGEKAKALGKSPNAVKAAVPTVAVCVALLVTVSAFEFAVRINTPVWTGIDDVSKTVNEITDEDDDVLVIGNQCNIYLKTDRRTKNKFFYQTPPIKMSETVFLQFMDEIKCSPPDYVVFFYEMYDYDEEEFLILIEHLESEKALGRYEYRDYETYGIYIRKD